MNTVWSNLVRILGVLPIAAVVMVLLLVAHSQNIGKTFRSPDDIEFKKMFFHEDTSTKKSRND